MSEKWWKRAERRIAEQLGGRRVPESGRQRGDAPDIEHWIEDALKQAQVYARDGRVPAPASRTLFA
jgi:hypothetical protein